MADLATVKQRADTLRRQLREIDQLTGRGRERERDIDRKREQRITERIVVIPPCANLRRRLEFESDDVRWLRYYFGPGSGVRDPFTYEFTGQQREMIDDFGAAIQFSGDQAEAASRGEGKSTIAERLTTKYTLQGVLFYTVLFQATGTLADNALDSIKTAIEENPLLLADYPEVCVPVRALENTPNRAHYQLVNGLRHDNGEAFEAASSRFTWCGQEIILPNVPGSPSAGAIIATRGLDAAVRGLKRRGRRPQLAIIDDPDTEETSRSEDQAAKLSDRIDKAIGGLGSQQKPIARLMLCTIPSRLSVAFKFTDPTQKPSWKGKRFKYLVTPPDRLDLVDEYVQLRALDWQDYAAGETEDKHCRRSHEFWLDKRVDIEAGAVVANPNRYNGEFLPDGSQVEVSALQHYYNEVARIGPEAVATEYDNDPPEEDGPIESGITAQKIQLRLSGYSRGDIPAGCTVIVQGIDIRKPGLHWVVKAFCPDATNYVIDYGFHETHGTRYGTDEGVELAIHRAILERMEQAKADYPTLGMTLVDSGWLAPAVYRATKEIGLGIYPSKGHGISHGCVSLSFSEVVKATKDRKPGDGWFMQKHSGGTWLVHCDTDRWKSFEHARWLTTEGKAGAAYLFGQITDEEKKWIPKRMPRDSREHFGFAQHLTAEIEVEDVVRGKLKRLWKLKSGRANNHYLDASYLCDVAASLLGVRLLSEPRQPKPAKRQKVTYL